MAQRARDTVRSEIKPNRALRQVRQASGMSQSGFAKSLGVSTPYVQAIELGQRAASVDFAEKVRNHTGAWPRCILEGWPEAVDVNGEPYTSDTYKRMLSKQPEASASEAQWQQLIEPMAKIIHGAAGVGKTSLAVSIVRDKLREAAEHILVLEGVSDALALQQLVAGKLTLGELRKHPELAALAGFHDDASREDNHVILLHHGSPPSAQADDLFKNLVPICATAHKKLVATITPRRRGKRKKATP